MIAAVIAVSVAVLALTALAAWVVKAIRDGERRGADWEARATVMAAELSSAKAYTKQVEDALGHERTAHARLHASYLRLATVTIPGLPDREAVEAAGGDPGPALGDRLLEPDWGAAPGSDAATAPGLPPSP